MTEQNKTPLTAQPGSAPAPEQKPAEKRPAEKPLRRVGSLTLGACLIAAGVFFLLYFFRSEERRVGKECRSRWSPYH